MKLVVWQDNWADEMDVVHVSILEDMEYDQGIELINSVPQVFWDQEDWYGRAGVSFGIGTNQFVSYRNAKEFLGSVKAYDISEEDAAKIRNWLGFTSYSSFGTHDVFGSVIESIYEWQDEQDPLDEEVP